MKGIKIAARGKSLPHAQPADEVLDTTLITLPIKKRRFVVTASPGVSLNTSPATAEIAHGLPFEPLFRGWIEPVDKNTGERTNQKISMPVIKDGVAYYIQSDAKNVIVSVVTTSPFTPSVKLVYTGFVYPFEVPYE